tara:strand:- start:320 stop:571 length:252 start_codon:yes stop_codon:yes gene_type:complete
MKTEQQLVKQILSNPKAFYRLTNQKKKFGYINNGLNYFMYLGIDKSGNGLSISVFKGAGLPLEVGVTQVRKFVHSKQFNKYTN